MYMTDKRLISLINKEILTMKTKKSKILIEKIVKWQSSQRNANEHLKRCLLSLIIIGMPIKTTLLPFYQNHIG